MTLRCGKKKNISVCVYYIELFDKKCVKKSANSKPCYPRCLTAQQELQERRANRELCSTGLYQVSGVSCSLQPAACSESREWSCVGE